MAGGRGGKRTRLFNLPIEPRILKASELISAMANPTRLSALYLLAKQELSITCLGELVEMSQPAMSQHLVVLKRTGLVTTRREHKTVHVRASDIAMHMLAVLDEILECGERP